MKKQLIFRVRLYLLTFSVFLLLSCNLNSNSEQIKPERSKGDDNIIPENPVHITWDGPLSEDIEAYKATVSIYTMNNRYDTGAVLTDSYGLSVKKINNRIYTRIDMKPDEAGRLRSAVSDGNEKKQNRVRPAGGMIFGDPSDQSYIITIIENYSDVEINTVQNSAFRALGGL